MPGLATPARCRPETIGDLRTLGESVYGTSGRMYSAARQITRECLREHSSHFFSRVAARARPGIRPSRRDPRYAGQGHQTDETGPVHYWKPANLVLHHHLESALHGYVLSSLNFPATPVSVLLGWIRPRYQGSRPYRMSLEGTRAAKTLRIFGAFGMGSFSNSKAFDGLPFS